MQDPPIAAVERAPLREALYESIAMALITGAFAPGERVKDTDLAARLGASRTPVREALLRLVDEGYLRNEPGRGFRVAPMTRREVVEVYELLGVLETHALQSSEPCSRRQSTALRELESSMQKSDGRAIETLKLDEAWHRTLLEGCSNQRLHESLRSLRGLATRYEATYFSTEGLLAASLREHRSIRTAFARGDRDRAIDLLTAHWIRSRDALLAASTLD